MSLVASYGVNYGPRATIDRKAKDVFLEDAYEVHELYAICPNGARLNRKPHVFVLARLQLGLAVGMLNTLKWYKL